MNKSTAKKIFIPLGIVFVVVGLALLYYFSRRIPTNPADAQGNTAGNLANGGRFCEYNGTIYFANPYDNGKLYSMDSDCSNIKKLSDDTVSYINTYGNFIYYIRNNGDGSASSVLWRGELYGVVRTRLNGSKEKTLFSGYCTDLHLQANMLVFNANENAVLSTFTTGLDGGTSDPVFLGDVSNSTILDGKIYYSNNDTNHCIYILDVSTGARTLLLDANTYMASVVNNKLYYIDQDNKNALTSIDLSSHAKTVLSGDRVVSYNVFEDVIFYQTENTKDHHAFKRMNVDGSNDEEILVGDVHQVCCTSRYTFFQLFGDDNLYRVATRRLNKVEKFYITYD